MEEIGQHWGRVANHIIASEIQIDLGQFEEALQELQSAKTEGLKTGERWLEAEILRLTGKLQARHSPSDRMEACECIQGAIELANEQGSKMFELRSLVTLIETSEEAEAQIDARVRVKELLSGIKADEDEWDIRCARNALVGAAIEC